MRKRNYSKEFKKQISKLKGKQFVNLLNKIDEILTCKDFNHYKNSRKPLHKYKRVHINNSYVILFLGDNDIVYFLRYKHHDEVYKR